MVANHRVLATFAPPFPHVAGSRYLARKPFLTFRHFPPTFVKGCSDMRASSLCHPHEVTVVSHRPWKAIDRHCDLDRTRIDIFRRWIGIFGHRVQRDLRWRMEGTKDRSWTVSFRDVGREVQPIIHGLLGPVQATAAAHDDPRDLEPIRPRSKSCPFSQRIREFFRRLLCGICTKEAASFRPILA